VDRGAFRDLTQADSYDSVGNYYSYVTHLCGFKGHKHEGKITGLAAYGKPSYLDLLKRYVAFGDGQIRNIGRCFDLSAIEKLEGELTGEFSHEDLSASVQVLLEESISEFCRHWVAVSGCRDVALAGGVFANVKLNQRIHELGNVDSVFIHPGMGDEGLAVGAALYEHSRRVGYQPLPVIQDVYLGGDIATAEAEAAIQEAGLRIIAFDGQVESETAKLLAAGKVIARCAGRMEYGPRALGNRTIMYQPTDPSVNQWLNDKLCRTEFMPFAPVTLWEERDRCYKNVPGAEETARFMTITFDCHDEMIGTCPAVCHVDKTARPQLIRREDNPSYYRIVEEYRKITGLPSIINTSFNMHEEPIVNTANEGVSAFLQSGLDALILGDFLAMK
jgi:carbamoyltransferase